MAPKDIKNNFQSHAKPATKLEKILKKYANLVPNAGNKSPHLQA